MIKKWMFVLCACLSGAGCNTTPTESLGEFHEILYVEGFLRAGNPVDSVFVGSTMPLFDVYDRDASAILDAIVSIEVDGTVHALTPVAGKLGYYQAPTLQIEAGKTYRLTVEAAQGIATAETTVPFPPSATGSSDVLSIGGETYRVDWVGDTQGGYVTTRKTQIKGEPVPIELQFGNRRPGGGGFGGTIDTTGFGAIRDSIALADQWLYLEGTATNVNAGQFSFYGTYAFLVYAIDGNYADFLVSSNQDPEILDEPRFHVDGGIGIFASMAADSVIFRVE
ncbi:MAG: hypothetical protein ACI8V2_004109 [Candidatus Latescibacterota bacterium]|jgi:hypothetical protein